MRSLFYRAVKAWALKRDERFEAAVAKPLRNRREKPKHCCSNESSRQSTGLCRQFDLPLLMGRPTTSAEDVSKLCAARTAPQAFLNPRKATMADGLAL